MRIIKDHANSTLTIPVNAVHQVTPNPEDVLDSSRRASFMLLHIFFCQSVGEIHSSLDPATILRPLSMVECMTRLGILKVHRSPG